MGLLSGLMGRASEVSVAAVEAEFKPILVEGEQLEMAFKVLRDMFVFTNKRLILVNRQGLTGSKAEYLTIPYSRIVRFSKESAGLMDLDAELKIWIQGQNEPIKREFRKDKNVNEIHRVLSQAVLG
jgi:Bacterial PH domain